ncbi:MAG: FecR domain-containing protein, partial [Prevotellaceae bacterium]|nr:FecR domain-containing protein [Prevotellaceae bacterium]
MASDKNHIEQLYVKYFSGNATKEETRTIYAHLNRSEAHRAEFEQLRNLWEVTHPAFEPCEIDVKKAKRKVSAAMQEDETAGQTIYKRLFPRWSRVAVAALIPLFIVSFFWYKEVYKPALLAGAVLEEMISPAGEITGLTLADGTKITLNAGSKLTYPKTFTGKQRNVTLEGEGYFDVAKNTSKPFIVHTRRMDIQVLGTKFNVSAYACLSEVKTTLEEGKVKIIVPNEEQSDMGDSFYLMPDEELSINTETGDITKRHVSAADSRRWLQGDLVFSATPLADVLKQIAHKYNVEIEIGS